MSPTVTITDHGCLARGSPNPFRGLMLLAGLLLVGCANSKPLGAPGHPGAPALWTPANKAGFGTARSWTHAQFVRLAWSIHVGYPIEQPTVVACRYTGICQR
ncbi:hypothetical protein POL68_09500 [Stigmatella sp. ncwal1]|uniref:Lipoprotein n=1 Tax=Stigmatella ashevillensis TaxID=2995309 RepID=A0ABT5D4V7_9BACT|nr:hypothetical protein [Stigmatella ashevillena]MDC0708702.1 hypothetical protein [Stigmatella ashevillena]